MMVRQVFRPTKADQKPITPTRDPKAGIARPEPKATSNVGPPAKPAPPLNKFTGNAD